MSGDLGDFLGRFFGQQVPGGCDDCDAYQTVERDQYGIWHLTVHHDDGCPWLAQRTGGKL